MLKRKMMIMLLVRLRMMIARVMMIVKLRRMRTTRKVMFQIQRL